MGESDSHGGAVRRWPASWLARAWCCLPVLGIASLLLQLLTVLFQPAAVSAASWRNHLAPCLSRHRQHRQHRLENGAVCWSPPTFTGPSRRDTWAVLPVWKLQQSEISISAVLQQQRVLPPQLLVQLQTEHNNNNNNDNNTETIFDRPVCRSMWSPTQQLHQ